MSNATSTTNRRWVVIAVAVYVCLAAAAISWITVFDSKSVIAAILIGIIAVLMPIRVALYCQNKRGWGRSSSIRAALGVFVVAAFVITIVVVMAMAM
ncbi:MAG: hypothetical protein WA359_10715 [Acidimicrobiales bacterium]